jgi:hypothetical protein
MISGNVELFLQPAGSSGTKQLISKFTQMNCMESNKTTQEIKEDRPNRAEIHHGSTTQGGSNFGQGSQDLGNKSIKQGSESNKGSNYDSEEGWNNEALRRKDISGPKGNHQSENE